MILDSSAIVAIALGEAEQFRLVRALAGTGSVAVAAPTWFETSLVLSSRMGPRLGVFLDGLRRQFAIQMVPFGGEHVPVALDAWQRYGNGAHPAKLNFGDCISYATARVAGEPLLFVGNDFAQTDIEVA